jgi:hypothetical protein
MKLKDDIERLTASRLGVCASAPCALLATCSNCSRCAAHHTATAKTCGFLGPKAFQPRHLFLKSSDYTDAELADAGSKRDEFDA